ncbi:magnesium transporter [Candidatus Gastranaerophilus sp. (ex Termes propinquus)]|nr:magnesium transporter [Candidatus Gastranaerophilus sp. (ex Termes propinquus)]
MIEILRTSQDGTLEELSINEAKNGSWFNLINPTEDEIQKVSLVLDLDEAFLRNCLDIEERSRVEIEDGHLLVITSVPIMEDESTFDTIPMGMIFTPTSFITVCSRSNKVIQSFNKDTAKFFDTNAKTRFMLSILFRISKFYLRYLTYINKHTDKIEANLHKSMKNKEIFQLLEIQKSLVYFTTALKDDNVVLQRIMRLTKGADVAGLSFSEDDIDLLEDVIIENRQAIEMVEMHRNILENMMDAFAAVVSNNLGDVMRFLTSLTILFAIPTMIGSFWGMNTAVPHEGNILGFYYVVAAALVCAVIAAIYLKKRKML